MLCFLSGRGKSQQSFENSIDLGENIFSLKATGKNLFEDLALRILKDIKSTIAFKRYKKNRKKIHFWRESLWWLMVNDISLLKETKKVEKDLSLLAGTISLGKKVCTFDWCLVLSQKCTKSFNGKNLALCSRFVPLKVKAYV